MLLVVSWLIVNGFTINMAMAMVNMTMAMIIDGLMARVNPVVGKHVVDDVS